MSVLRTELARRRRALLGEGNRLAPMRRCPMAYGIFINLLRMRYAHVHAYKCVLKKRVRCFMRGRIAEEFVTVVLPDVPR